MISINDRVIIWSGTDRRFCYLIPTIKMGKPLGAWRIEIWLLFMVIGIDIIQKGYEETID